MRVTPRLIGYCVLLVGLISLWTFLVFTRTEVETTFLRAPGTLFQQMPDGHFSNLYLVKVVNKTSREVPIELKLENVAGTLQVMGQQIVVAPQKLAENSILVELDSSAMKSGTTPLTVGVYSNGKRIQTIKTSFIGPRNDAGQ
jgi:hypothetical protein